MKRSQIILIVLACCMLTITKSSYSQLHVNGSYPPLEYFPLVEENKVWSELMIEYSFVWDSVYHTYKFKISGDTIIDQMSYKKVYKQDLHYGFDWYFYTAFREDLDGKVYMWDEEEWLLYDFSAEQGDTVYSGWYVPCANRVEAVDSVLVGSGYRKRMYMRWLGVDWDHNEVWIEGIGSNFGLVMAGLGPTVGLAYRSLCVHDLNGLLYMNPNYSSCEMTNVSVAGSEQMSLSVYPNPASDLIILKGGQEREYEYDLYDVRGQLIIDGNIQAGNCIDISSCNKGLYFLNLKTRNQQKIIKLIKQ